MTAGERQKWSNKMIIANMEILTKEVLDKCTSRNVEAYTLKNSKANTIAFSTNNRRRREFEITFLKDACYRVSTRFLGYKSVMAKGDEEFFVDNDPDGRRKKFNVNLDTVGAVNKLILDMLENGFSETPDVQYQ